MVDERFVKWSEHLYKLLKKYYEKYKEGSKEHKSYATFYFFLDSIKKRIENDFDFVVAMTGGKGLGKSSASIYAGFVLSHMLGSYFDLKENVIYGYDYNEARVKMSGKSRSVFVIDEAIDYMFSADAVRRINKFYAKLFTKLRKMNNVIFLNMPRFRFFSNIFKGDLIHARVEILNRTRDYANAALMLPDRDPDNHDPWFTEHIKKKKRKKIYSAGDVIKRIRKHPCFVTMFKIPKLPNTLYEIYKKGSEEALEKTFENELTV